MFSLLLVLHPALWLPLYPSTLGRGPAAARRIGNDRLKRIVGRPGASCLEYGG